MRGVARCLIRRAPVLLLLVLLAGCSTMSGFTDAGPADSIIMLSSGWEYRLAPSLPLDDPPPASPPDDNPADWMPLGELELEDLLGAPDAWFRISIPHPNLSHVFLVFTTQARALAVYADGRRIYEYCSAVSGGRGVSWHTVRLPQDLHAKRLWIYLPRAQPGAFDLAQSALLSATAFPQSFDRYVLAVLRRDLDETLAGFVLVVLGTSVLVFSAFRWKQKDQSMPSFGAVCLLYGLRLLSDGPLPQLLTQFPPLSWYYMGSFITYVIPIPFTVFVWQVFGRRWKLPIRLLIAGQVLFAVIGISLDMTHHHPYAAMTANNVIVLAGAVLLYVAVLPKNWREVRGLKVLLAGCVVMSLFALNENLANLGLLPWNSDAEYPGFLFFAGCIGFIAAERFLENEKRLLEIGHELETARQIQASILPRELPIAQGLEIAVRYVPMNSIAGDYYDFVDADSTGLGILIADVSGHGVPAALIASMVKVALTSQAPHASDPARVLAGMNMVFCGRLQAQFITAAYLFVDPANRRILHANAGHPPVLLWRASDRTLQTFQGGGLILGFQAEAQYDTLCLSYSPGDRIFLYTDGILEATNTHGEFYGETRFREVIQEHEHSRAAALADEFLRHLDEWCGRSSKRRQEDDLTLMVVDTGTPRSAL